MLLPQKAGAAGVNQEGPPGPPVSLRSHGDQGQARQRGMLCPDRPPNRHCWSSLRNKKLAPALLAPRALSPLQCHHWGCFL